MHHIIVQAFIVLSALLLTPLAWLRDMSSIALVSFSGLIASMASIVLVAWEGTAYTGVSTYTSQTDSNGTLSACPALKATNAAEDSAHPSCKTMTWSRCGLRLSGGMQATVIWYVHAGLNLGGAQVPVLNMTGLPLTAGVVPYHPDVSQKHACIMLNLPHIPDA